MKRTFLELLIMTIPLLYMGCKQTEKYQVFAVKFCEEGKSSANQLILGANTNDSVDICNMFWLIQDRKGKNILVDAGFIDSTNSLGKYIRPDSVLQRLNISSQDISDIILTHPHYDHIDGISLFPKAQVWIQKEDYDYFIGPAWQVNGDSIGFTRADVQKILDVNSSGRLKLVSGDNIEIMPGIKIFIGSKHTYQNQYLLVNSNSKRNKILLASDAIWFYLNLEKQLPVSVCMDPGLYVKAMERMKTLVTNPNLIIPGHDDKVFSKFPIIQDWIVRIEE
jgi:glyoxylase-like metal-dependent hydrolase (beta-lactamase superfamily II)